MELNGLSFFFFRSDKLSLFFRLLHFLFFLPHVSKDRFYRSLKPHQTSQASIRGKTKGQFVVDPQSESLFLAAYDLHDKMEKASIKHLDFQLQREKARSNDLEAECKALHAQIAQLEQDKAGLRREKLVLVEESKKIAKLDDRIHSLQKEVESRDAIIASERAAAEQARAEVEEIRSNANASIAQWIEAEKQWTAEQTAMNEAAVLYRSKIDELEVSLRKVRNEFAETARLLDIERDRAKKVAESREALEAEVRSLHSQAEKLQSKLCDLEQTIYKLDLAGDKQRETIGLKETEIRTLEAALENERCTVERMEQTIVSLNDRVNAAKMVSLGEKGENEKLQCDVTDAKKEIARLNLHVESLKRDANFSAQSQSGLQKALDEMREKCRLQQDDLKEKCVEIRRHELTISQLNVELKKSENQGGERSFQISSLEAELQRTRDALKNSVSTNESLVSEKEDLAVKLCELQSVIEAKEEEMVLLQSQSDERAEVFTRDIRNLEAEVAARQSVINDLTEQLSSTSEKNAVYHSKILEESEMTDKVRQELAHMLSHVHAKERELHFCECVAQKSDLFASWLNEWSSIPRKQTAEWFASWQTSQDEATELRQRMQLLSQRADEAEHVNVERADALREKEQLIADLQSQVECSKREIAEITAGVGASRAEMDALRMEAELSTQQISSLKQKVTLLDKQLTQKEGLLSEKDTQRVEMELRLMAELATASSLQARALQCCDEQMNCLQTLWQERFEVIGAFFLSVLASGSKEAAQLLLAKEQAESACRELTLFAKEAKTAMSKGNRALAEKQEVFLSRIALLEGQVALLQREKEQGSAQLSALLRRFEDEQRAHEAYKKESQKLVEMERSRNIVVEKDLAKLRIAVNYEVSRKCEYKAALDGAKKLLGESEEMRAADSARALEAINKANKESNYWVLCFDRLKGMVERSRRNGKRLPSIDADTVHRLEEAKTNMSLIPAQDVNLVMAGAPKLKRLRDEAPGSLN